MPFSDHFWSVLNSVKLCVFIVKPLFFLCGELLTYKVGQSYLFNLSPSWTLTIDEIKNEEVDLHWVHRVPQSLMHFGAGISTSTVLKLSAMSMTLEFRVDVWNKANLLSSTKKHDEPNTRILHTKIKNALPPTPKPL